MLRFFILFFFFAYNPVAFSATLVSEEEAKGIDDALVKGQEALDAARKSDRYFSYGTYKNDVADPDLFLMMEIKGISSTVSAAIKLAAANRARGAASLNLAYVVLSYKLEGEKGNTIIKGLYSSGWSARSKGLEGFEHPLHFLYDTFADWDEYKKTLGSFIGTLDVKENDILNQYLVDEAEFPKKYFHSEQALMHEILKYGASEIVKAGEKRLEYLGVHILSLRPACETCRILLPKLCEGIGVSTVFCEVIPVKY